jgi:hypothetical protein
VGVKIAEFTGTIALCAALGAILVGHGVVLPALAHETGLIDANLARALAGPAALRIGDVVLGASIVVGLSAPRWLRSRIGTTLALVLVAAAAANRVVVTPAVYEAWSRVDLVAARPADRLARAQELANNHTALLVTMVLLLLGIVWLVVHRRPTSAAPGSAHGSGEATPEPEPWLTRPATATTSLDA